jgi:AraC-like DNA-binding protein
MFYKEYSPSPQLSGYVQCYWILRSSFNPFPAPERLIPDGSIELIFNFGAPYQRSRVTDEKQQELIKGSHIVGQRAQCFLIEQQGAIDHVAIRFKPGGLYPFVRLPVSELTNCAVEAEFIFGPACREIESRLFEAKSNRQRIQMLENFLQRRLLRVDQNAQLVHAALSEIAKTNGNIPIGTLIGQSRAGYKQWERKFLAVVGITPKFYSRVVRFLAVFNQMKHDPLDNWSAVAMACGYYDQAHFIKEFKEFTGTTPAQFFAHQNYIAEMITSSNPVSNFYNTGS